MSDASVPIPAGRREQRKVERRAAIVKVATRMFLERGYAGTSLSALVEEMGGSKGTLWSYFSSKEELFAAVVDTAADSFRAEMGPLLSRRGNIKKVLTDLVEKFIERITSAEAIALKRLIVGEAGRAPEIGRIFYERAPARTHVMVNEYLAGQMADGSLRAADPHEATGLLFRLCAGGLQEQIMWGMDTPTREAIHKEAVFVVKHFLAAFATRQPTSASQDR